MASATRLSSKGQVVIPAWARRRLKLAVGDVLQVEVGSDTERTIVLRGIATRRDVEQVLARGQAWFEATGRDLVEELHASRRQARLREKRRRP